MFVIPANILNKLKCSLCDGYLNADAVVVKSDKQICAKCYKILPLGDQEQCLRQISYEALCSCLVFPCRYNKMGCEHTYTWNHENGHEAECKKRYFTLPDVVSLKEDNIVESDTLDNASQDTSYIAKYSKIASSCLIAAETRAPGNTNPGFTVDEDQKHVFGVKKFSQSAKRSYNMSPDQSMKLLNNNNAVSSTVVYENIYHTIPSVSVKNTILQCLSCNAFVDKSNQNICLFRHILCNNCQGDMCIACVKNLSGTSKVICKNASKGCKELLNQSDVGFHRDNCKFNEISCPFEECPKIYMLEELILHLRGWDHSGKVIHSNEVTKNMGQNDQSFIFVCYEEVFKCLYYYYFHSVEAVVLYLGPCVRASEFFFEVSIEVQRKTIKRKLICASWNDYMLASGISFDRNELKTRNDDKPLEFAMNLRIFKSAKS